ncbi:MAG TPA: hypothetical protein VD967_02760 [Candidatus Paceibacterota bacterium]|nr:hypothetical protein [Candidatus Paceibacterota bacterium]
MAKKLKKAVLKGPNYKRTPFRLAVSTETNSETGEPCHLDVALVTCTREKEAQSCKDSGHSLQFFQQLLAIDGDGVRILQLIGGNVENDMNDFLKQALLLGLQVGIEKPELAKTLLKIA